MYYSPKVHRLNLSKTQVKGICKTKPDIQENLNSEPSLYARVK